MLEPVIQEEATGCGIACAAAILGKSYEEMKATANALGIYANDEALWSDTAYVRTLLAESGVETSDSEFPFKSWIALPPLALLSIKNHRENGKNFWHWIVFERERGIARVLDPASDLSSNVRVELEDIHPAWFIEVKK